MKFDFLRPHHSSRRQQVCAWLVLIAILAIWFGTLGLRHLLPSDEGRYAEIAREMFNARDWVTIRYNDLLYFEKPPFHLWLTVLAYHLFGVGDWQARLGGAMSAMMGVLAIILATQRWFGRRTGILAGLVLIACPFWIIGGHFNSLDITLAGSMACVLAAFLLAQHPQTKPAQTRQWMWVCWASMAISMLTKGLVGIVLPSLALASYLLITRDWRRCKKFYIASGLLIFGIISAPWFILMAQRHPDFLYFFFIHEHFQRYLSTVHSRPGPFWYFVPLLVLGFFPWLTTGKRMVDLVAAESHAFSNQPKLAVQPLRPLLLIAIWISVIFIFFSISHSKLPGYISPIFPGLAILAACALTKTDRAFWQRQGALYTFLHAGCFLGALTLIFYFPFQHKLQPGQEAAIAHYGQYLSIGFFGMMLGCCLVWKVIKQPMLACIIFACTFYAGISFLWTAHEIMGEAKSGAATLPAIQRVLTSAMPVYLVGRLDHTLPFYLRRTATLVQEQDELAFGIAHEPQKWLPTIAAFTVRWQSGAPALAIMPPSIFTQLQAQKIPMQEIARDYYRVVVINRKPDNLMHR